MPQYDLGILITVNIGIGILSLGGTMAMLLYMGRLLDEARTNTASIAQSTERVAEMTREVAFMIRRQYGDIDRDLREIKELLRGQ